MTILDFLAGFGFWSRERMGLASKSEIGRWLRAGAVLVNGEVAEFNERLDFPLISLVLFPKGKRITML